MTDRDAALAPLLDRVTPPLAAYELDWDDVLKRTKRAPSRRRIGLLATALIGVAALALALTTPWSGGPSIVDRAQAALATPPGTVLHVKWRDTFTDNLGHVNDDVTDAWMDDRGRWHGFVTDARTGRRVEIGGTHDLRQSVEYDPATNSIGWGLVTGGAYAFGDPVDVLRRELAEGTATAMGRATIHGRSVDRIHLRLVGVDCKPVVHYLFVDPETYEPVEYRVTVFIPNRVRLVRRFLTYARLPATTANLRRTDIRAAHPTAKVYPPLTTRPSGPACAGPAGS